VDLPEDRADCTFDGRDGKVDGTDERSTINAPQCISATETTAVASPLPTPTGDPPLRIWHCGLIAAAVNTIVHDDPIDYRPENYFQYSAASLCTIEQAKIDLI
jgi:hypothetical protein